MSKEELYRLKYNLKFLKEKSEPDVKDYINSLETKISYFKKSFYLYALADFTFTLYWLKRPNFIDSHLRTLQTFRTAFFLSFR